MEGQIAPPPADKQLAKTRRPRPAHLMCGTPFWGFAGLLACSYLAYISFARVRRGDVDWPRDVWSLVTYAIWVLLMAGLIGETRCRRERIFFTLILVNFTLGFVFAAWGNIPDAWARNAREIAAGLWALAAVVSGVLMFSSGRGLKRGAGRHV